MSDSTPQNKDPGEKMNVREVHGAIMRELDLPGEKMRRVPWYLHLTYIGLALWAYVYFAHYSGNFDWNEYEHRPLARAKRDALERQAELKRAEDAAAELPPSVATPKP